MKLNTTHVEILKSISEAPRQKHHFYESGRPPQIVERSLSYLSKAGLLELDGNRYCLTEEGRDEFRNHQPTPARTFGNAAMTSIYVPTPWNCRPGSQDHLRVRSRGIGA